MTDAVVPAKFKRNRELRHELCLAVGVQPGNRYLGQNRSLRKRHIRALAQELDVETDAPVDELTLEELYAVVCKAAGGEYQGNAGNQWGICRANLKRLHGALVQGGGPA